MIRKPVGLIAAFLLALIGTLLLVAYVQAARTKTGAKETLFPVLVVTKPIAKGTDAKEFGDSVKVVEVPLTAKATDGLSSLTDVKGKVTTTDLLPGEQVLKTRFATRQESAAAVAGPGKVEVTVSLTPERAMGGRLLPGDVVDVVASFASLDGAAAVTRLAVTNVKVTSVQVTEAPAKEDKPAQPDAATQAPAGAFLVTFAVSPHDAERIVFAAEHGKVWLAANGTVAPDGSRLTTIAEFLQ